MEDEDKSKLEVTLEEEPEAKEPQEGEAPHIEAEPEPVPERQEHPNPEAGVTPPADGQPAEQPAEQPLQQEKMIPQSQVNELVGKARAEGREKGREEGYKQAKSEALGRYGVESDDELDGLFANGSRYQELSERFEAEGNTLKDVKTELALVKSQILPERQSDVKAILAANGLEVTEENISSLLPTHPEWKASEPKQQAAPVPTPQTPAQPKQVEPPVAPSIQKLGIQPQPEEQKGEESERERAMKLYGLDK